MKNATASFWLNELNAGTVKGAVNNNPSDAVEFFGSVPALREDPEELRLIAGCAWRMSATDEQLTATPDSMEELLGNQTPDEMREEAARLYSEAIQGKRYNPKYNDGETKR